MWKNVVLAAGVAGALFGLVPHAATASENEKIFPGAMCQPDISSAVVLRDNSGRMLNFPGAAPSKITQTWICPVVRDINTADGVEYAKIVVIGATASCSFRSMTETGGTVAVATPNTIVPLSGGLRRLEYAVGAQNIANKVGGYYYFVCSIPLGSGVQTYSVTENNGED